MNDPLEPTEKDLEDLNKLTDNYSFEEINHIVTITNLMVDANGKMHDAVCELQDDTMDVTCPGCNAKICFCASRQFLMNVGSHEYDLLDQYREWNKKNMMAIHSFDEMEQRRNDGKS